MSNLKFGKMLCTRTSFWHDKRPCEEATIAKPSTRLRAWEVNIPDADALCSFIDKYGRVILGEAYDDPEGRLDIEIYDDYRE